MTISTARVTRVILQRLVALVLAGLSGTSCTSVCDESGLRTAAEAFAGGAERRQVGLTALQDACPTLPAAFAENLFADVPAEDPTWRELLARTCQPVPAPTTPITLEQLDVDARRICDLDRHGLLAPEATFARRDIVVFMLYEWLLAGRVDKARASEVVVALLTAGALATEDLTPPQSTSDAPQEGGVELRISPTMLYVEGEAVLPLVRGRAMADAFTGHASAKLRGAFAEAGRRRHVRAERAGTTMRARVSVLADRSTPMLTILDAAHTATGAGFTAFELLVHDGDELRGLPFKITQDLPPQDDEWSREKPLGLLYTVHADSIVESAANHSTSGRSPGITWTRSTTCAPNAYDCLDLATLVKRVKRYKSMFPNEVVATYHVDPDVTLLPGTHLQGATTIKSFATVGPDTTPVDVEVGDGASVVRSHCVRGEGCALIGPYKGESMPDECMFWRTILDLNPPLDDRLIRDGEW